MTIAWRNLAPDFEPDGSLRDVRILGTELRDWDAVLALVRADYQPLRFTIDGEPAPVPIRAGDAFAMRDRAAPLLNFSVGGIDVACHFFTPGDVEFDLQPHEVDGPERLEALVEFLRRLAAVSGKAALLTAENQPDSVILRADPAAGSVVHEPPADAPAI